jgi:hypothetical protein
MRRLRSARAFCGLVVLLGLGPLAAAAQTDFRLRYGNEPVHPACVHALAMQERDAVPVTTAVSLEGCSASARSRSAVRFEDGFAVFEDADMLSGGSFGYRELTQLENGIIGLVILRAPPEGEQQVSLAAVEIVERPMIRRGRVVQVQMLELLGELWIPGMQMLSFRSVGNLVHFDAGAGPEKVERTVDFTELGKLRR